VDRWGRVFFFHHTPAAAPALQKVERELAASKAKQDTRLCYTDLTSVEKFSCVFPLFLLISLAGDVHRSICFYFLLQPKREREGGRFVAVERS